jgi:hypothetical protein
MSESHDMASNDSATTMTDGCFSPQNRLTTTTRNVLEAGPGLGSVRGAVDAARVLDYFKAGDFKKWQSEAPALGEQWREVIKGVIAAWSELDGRRRFAVLQQTGSILRTCLVNDLESRLW